MLADETFSFLSGVDGAKALNGTKLKFMINQKETFDLYN